MGPCLPRDCAKVRLAVGIELKLQLGVANFPYADAKRSATTEQVAGWLEAKYHIMETFYEIHKTEIAEAMTASLTSALLGQEMGAPLVDPMGDAMQKVELLFREFLTMREMETLGIPGVPTEAALRGVNHRMKRNHGPRRPSFIDTGLYETSFKSWLEP